MLLPWVTLALDFKEELATSYPRKPPRQSLLSRTIDRGARREAYVLEQEEAIEPRYQ